MAGGGSPMHDSCHKIYAKISDLYNIVTAAGGEGGGGEGGNLDRNAHLRIFSVYPKK